MEKDEWNMFLHMKRDGLLPKLWLGTTVWFRMMVQSGSEYDAWLIRHQEVVKISVKDGKVEYALPNMVFNNDDIGKNVFLTAEDAERQWKGAGKKV